MDRGLQRQESLNTGKVLVAIGASSPYNHTNHAMTSKITRERIKFRDIAIGQRFFDPISAEYFIKQSAELAAMVTGVGDGTIPDEFEAEDIVGIDV